MSGDADVMERLRAVACEAGVHRCDTLGQCTHSIWVRGETVTAEMMNAAVRDTLNTLRRMAL